jgi:hypothetical protein
MVPSNWINIYETLKNGEIDAINRNEYIDFLGNVITSSTPTVTNDSQIDKIKIKSLSGYTIGLKYLLNNYNVNENTLNSPVTIARKYLKMPVQISDNTRLEEFIQPIQSDKNYVFYFPYYISNDPSIENGSYPVAPIQNEADGNVLTFPPNVTLVFDPGAFLKLGGTIFDIGQSVPSRDYEISSYDINKNRLLLKKEEFLWVDIQGEIQASPYQIFKVWNIEYTNFSNHPNPYLKDLGEKIVWIYALGVVKGPQKNNILYPQWWGQEKNKYNIHFGQANVSVGSVYDRQISRDLQLQQFKGSGIRDLDFRPMTPNQLAIQSCIDASREGQEIHFTENFVVHQVFLKPNRKYIGYGSTIERLGQSNASAYIDTIVSQISENYFSSAQQAYLINLLFVALWRHIGGKARVRNRDNLLAETVFWHGPTPESKTSLKIYKSNFNNPGNDPIDFEQSKQMVKNSIFIEDVRPDFIEPEEDSVNDNNIVNAKNRQHLYGVSIGTRIQDLFMALSDHLQSNTPRTEANRNTIRHNLNVFNLNQNEFNQLNKSEKIVYLFKKYNEHLAFHKNMTRLPVSAVDVPARRNPDVMPEIYLQQFIGWRTNLSEGNLFEAEINETNSIKNKLNSIVLEGFNFYGPLSNLGIYDGFDLEQNGFLSISNDNNIDEFLDQMNQLQMNVYLKNSSFQGSVGDGINIIKNTRNFMNNNFFTDCWRGAFSVSGGFDTIFCTNLINQDRDLYIKYNNYIDENQFVLRKTNFYTGIESENVKNSDGFGWTQDTRMTLLTKNIYISGNFDFTFDSQSQILMQGTISDQSLWKISCRNKETVHQNTIDVRLCDSIYTVSEFGGPKSSSSLTIQRFCSMYMDQILFQGKPNLTQKLILEKGNRPSKETEETEKKNSADKFVGLLILRDHTEYEIKVGDEDVKFYESDFEYNLCFSHCQIIENLILAKASKIGIYSIVYAVDIDSEAMGSKIWGVQKNNGLIVLSKLILSPSLHCGVSLERDKNYFDASNFAMIENDYIKINKSFLSSAVSLCLENKIASVVEIDLSKTCNVIMNGNNFTKSPLSWENYKYDIVLLQTTSESTLYLETKNMIHELKFYLIILNAEDVNGIFIDSFSDQWIYGLSPMIGGTSPRPMIAGLQGDRFWIQDRSQIENEISWICSSTGEMMDREEEIGQVPDAQWSVYMKQR